MVDPDPRVSSKGIQKLRKHGVDVYCGLKADLSKELNSPFIYRVLTGRPYSILWTKLSYSNERGLAKVEKPDLESIVKILQAYEILPEVDTIYLTSDDYNLYINDTKAWKNIIETLPSHISLVLRVDLPYPSNKSDSVTVEYLDYEEFCRNNVNSLKDMSKFLYSIYQEVKLIITLFHYIS